MCNQLWNTVAVAVVVVQGPSGIRGCVVNDSGADCRNVDCSPVSYLREA